MNRSLSVPGWPPHPLEVDIRQIPFDTLRISAGGSAIAVYVAACPDGCGLVAWTDTTLPFNAPDLETVIAAITRP
jgi:hypothetical protein